MREKILVKESKTLEETFERKVTKNERERQGKFVQKSICQKRSVEFSVWFGERENSEEENKLLMGEINKRDRKGYDFVAKKSFGCYAILSSLGAPFCFRYVVTFVLHVEFVSLFISLGC
jgi:hypothetical protein